MSAPGGEAVLPKPGVETEAHDVQAVERFHPALRNLRWLDRGTRMGAKPARSVIVFEWMIVVSTFFCFVSLYFGSFDPQGGLEMLIATDLYGQPAIPDAARPMFRFVFALFAWISVVTFFLEWAILRFALRKGEPWAFWVLLIGHLLWSGGAVGIALVTGAKAYLWSAGIVSALTLPPFLLMKKAIAPGGAARS